MKHKTFLVTTALIGALVAFPAAAQQAGQDAGQAQGGLPGQRLAQEQAQGQGAQIYVSPAGTREIQQALNNAGYDVGNVDGQWNETTRSAARNFQQANGLEPTGTLTVRTLAALGLESLLQGEMEGGGLPGQRLAQETTQGEGTQLYASPAAVRLIQQALNEAGYDVGNVDGQWNQETQEAARNFSQAQGLEPTGVLDIGLIQALGMTGQVFQPQVEGAGQQQAQAGGGGAQGGLPDQRIAQEQASSEGTPLYLSPAQVREITLALNAAGYDAGNVDAGWSDATTEAARNYQQAKGLEPTGSLTTALMAQLGMTDWMSGGGGSPSATGAVGGRQGGQQQILQEGAGGGLGGGGGGETPAPIQPQ